MEKLGTCGLDYVPENILIDVLSFLSPRELIRAGRVCKKWKRVVKDQRLWRFVDLTAWKVTSRILWTLLRQYLGCGLRCLRLRGLLLSARGGVFLSVSWLKALSIKCPRLSKLYLQYTDLRSLSSCQLLPPSLQMLELHGCELSLSFFNQRVSTSSSEERAEATSSVAVQQQGQGQTGKQPDSPLEIPIETLVLNNVPSFTDQHLQSLTSWKRLSRLELHDTFRVTSNGLRSCAAKNGVCGVTGLSKLKFLAISINQGSQLQVASSGLGSGWLGLEELNLGGKEVWPGLLHACHLKDLKRLCLWGCLLSEVQIVHSCRMLRGLRRLEFVDVIFQPQQCPPVGEVEGRDGEEEQDGEEATVGDISNNDNATHDTNDPIPSLRLSLAGLLPSCVVVFTNCSVQINAE